MAALMAVLTRDVILAEIDAGRLRVDPLARDQVGGASIDLTLGDEIRVMNGGAAPIDVRADEDFWTTRGWWPCPSPTCWSPAAPSTESPSSA